MGLNFRAEFFNLWNHAQFGLPVNDLAVATLNPADGTIQKGLSNGFGAATSTVNNPRLIQFALKLTF